MSRKRSTMTLVANSTYGKPGWAVIRVIVRRFWKWLTVAIIGYTAFVIFWVITIMHFSVKGM